LDPVALASNLDFTTAELRRVQRLVVEHQSRLLEAWNEYFGEAPGRACEGRAVYRRRPGCRSAGRPHHLGAARLVRSASPTSRERGPDGTSSGTPAPAIT
jgi:hypothetical protein